MRMRTTGVVLALLVALLWAAPARAEIVYVKGAGTASPVVYVASNEGADPRRLGIGRAPTISPDGRYVAFITVPTMGSQLDAVVLTRLESGSQRLVMRAKAFDSLRFSPDSKLLAAIASERRLRVYDVEADRRFVAAEGPLRGYSFSPDSSQVVYGEAVRGNFQARSDLYIGAAKGTGDPRRLTRSRDAVNPVWGPEEIVYDRFRRRRDDAPAYNLFAITPDGQSAPRRLTRLTIPALASGLVPLEISADANRMLAVFTGQDAQLGFTVRLRDGKTRALSRDFEHGLVGFDLSADGRTILAHTGGPDPGAAHDVVRVPYGGGEPTVLVEDAAYPDWTE